MNFFSKEPKIHLFQDNHCAKPRSGRGRIANTVCRHNSSNVQTTTMPENVTCILCLRVMAKQNIAAAIEKKVSDWHAEVFESMRTSINELEDEKAEVENEAQMLRRLLNALWSSLDGTAQQHTMLNKHVCISDLIVPHLKEPRDGNSL